MDRDIHMNGLKYLFNIFQLKSVFFDWLCENLLSFIRTSLTNQQTNDKYIKKINRFDIEIEDESWIIFPFYESLRMLATQVVCIYLNEICIFFSLYFIHSHNWFVVLIRNHTVWILWMISIFEYEMKVFDF